MSVNFNNLYLPNLVLNKIPPLAASHAVITIKFIENLCSIEHVWIVCPGRHWMAEQGRVSFTAFWIESGSGRGWCPLSPVAVVWPWLRSPRSYNTPLGILTVKEAANPQLTSLTTAAAPSAGEPLQKKQMRIIFFMDGEYLDQHNYQIKTFIFQSHNNTNRPLHSKDFVYLSDIIKLLNNKEMKWMNQEPRIQT